MYSVVNDGARTFLYSGYNATVGPNLFINFQSAGIWNIMMAGSTLSSTPTTIQMGWANDSAPTAEVGSSNCLFSINLDSPLWVAAGSSGPKPTLTANKLDANAWTRMQSGFYLYLTLTLPGGAYQNFAAYLYDSLYNLMGYTVGNAGQNIVGSRLLFYLDTGSGTALSWRDGVLVAGAPLTPAMFDAAW